MSTEYVNQPFTDLATAARQLTQAVSVLSDAASVLQPPPLDSCEWHEQLRQKLLPQLGTEAWLVAAVVGGTNIGKSVVFNHLAGGRASSTSPLASGTKHPVCLVPDGFTERQDLKRVFPDFDLSEWSDADDALRETTNHELFWRTSSDLPSTLLVLDTPDIDSDVRVNWVRADAIRRSADVLIAVLTQQKYNDAAVKEFFRKAADEDKAVLVVFNQCLLPDDEEFWPVWLETFCRETGITPESVYLAPADRTAAEELRLPFFERVWPVTADGPPQPVGQPRNLRADLSSLRFHEIRVRTLRGSVRELLSNDHGVPSWMQLLHNASEDLKATSERLSSDAVLKIRDWPVPPASLFVAEIRTWWKSRQQGWARRINRLYDKVGAGVLWPVKVARNAIQGEPIEPLVQYREREWSAILTTIEELFDKLQWMAESGNQMIRPRIELVLQGVSRTQLIETLRRRHLAVDFRLELNEVVHQEMERFSVDSPELFTFYRQLNHVSAVVRPMTSVVLFSLGFGPAGETVAPFVADAAANAVVHVVADVAGGAAAAVAGDTAVGTAGKGASMLQAWFHNLNGRYTERRVNWLTDLIRREMLGTLPEDLQRASSISDSVEWKNVSESLAHIESLLQETHE
ncbi:MAG: GTPase domain-containing protein [Fuerstiella sp.]|nr:GTPase domain-containing protein [Fuerstiella sp.]